MKKMNEKLYNFPDNIKPIATAVEGQALEDEEEFDKRKEEVENEINKKIKLPLDGAPNQPKPEEPIVPKMLDESLFYEDENDADTEDEYVDIEDSIKDYVENLIDDILIDADNIPGYDLEWMSETTPESYVEAKDNFIKELIKYMMANNKDFSIDESYSIVENINEEDAARIIQEVIKHKFGIDVEVATYKDTENSKCVIVQFIASEEECKKMPYDDLKEEMYKRFNNEINISCKQFSSPNLKNKGTEYKLKLFVIKEKKDKSKIYNEDLNLYEDTNNVEENHIENINDEEQKKKKIKDLRNDPRIKEEEGELLIQDGNKLLRVDPTTGEGTQIPSDYHGRKFDPTAKGAKKLSLWSRAYNELSKQSHAVKGGESYNLLIIPEGERYFDTVGKTDFELDGNDIIVHKETEDDLNNAKRVAEFYDIPYDIKYNPNSKKENFKYSIRLKFTDDQLPTEEEEERFDYDYDSDKNFDGMLDEPNTDIFKQSESSLVHDSYTNDDLYDEDDHEDNDEFDGDAEIDDSKFDPDAEEELEKEEAKTDELKKKSKNESLQTKLNFKNDLKAFNRVMERFYDVMNE